MRRLAGCVSALILAGCSSGLGPDASNRLPALAAAHGSAVNLYWPCLVDVPAPQILRDNYRVEIDGRDVGEMTRCGYGRFEVTEGRHAIRLRSPLLLDVAGAFGMKGAEYTIPPNGPIYIRLSYFRYVEYQQVAPDVGIREITAMAKS
ncbi:hypothetical protein [Hyphomicrobium sp.]|uniref:hypothetical protein n=1 Tax=Hyphomicrobium sp. TaxID=82 RepID=UPI000F955A4B|nr:hypothetical protein [Hyphomicrobium sp.]RUO99360.1 MAG: hypothetical protein EKK30_05475 [Hyphomicrobium sp.]